MEKRCRSQSDVVYLSCLRLDTRFPQPYNGLRCQRWSARCRVELDDNFKRLIKELGEAINESLADSEKISEVMSRVRNAGYDLFLVLEVTIGFNKRGEINLVHRQKLNAEGRSDPDFHLTSQDTQFLRALKITVDENLHE